MYLTYGIYADGSGFTHVLCDTIEELVTFLLASGYDYYTVFRLAEYDDGSSKLEIVYDDVPESKKGFPE